MIKKILLKSMNDFLGAKRKIILLKIIAFYMIAILAFAAIKLIS